MAFRDYLELLARGTVLSEDDLTIAFGAIFNGQAAPEQTAAFLQALRMQGETPLLLKTVAQIMREKMIAISAPPDAIDIVGTGGDGLNSLNISTATALVVAACGVPVAKHGNRAASSQSGAADVLAALGVNINAPPEVLKQALYETGFAFLLAPTFHPALAAIAPVRKALGIRTIFNLIGPLANPAGISKILLGVSDLRLLPIYAETLPQLGIRNAWLVTGLDGMDELSPCGDSDVISLKKGTISRFVLTPEDAGLPRCAPEDITGGDAAYNAAALSDLLAGAPSAYRNAVLYNAGAALLIANRAGSLLEGVRLAAQAIDSGSAQRKLVQYKEITD